MATLKSARRVVIKIGSALLVESGSIRTKWLDGLARDIADLSDTGADVLIVSSGSIALGRGVLDLPTADLALERCLARTDRTQVFVHPGEVGPEIARRDLRGGQRDCRRRRRVASTRTAASSLTGNRVPRGYGRCTLPGPSRRLRFHRTYAYVAWSH